MPSTSPEGPRVLLVRVVAKVLPVPAPNRVLGVKAQAPSLAGRHEGPELGIDGLDRLELRVWGPAIPVNLDGSYPVAPA